MLKDIKVVWLVIAGILVTIFELFSLSGVSLPPRESAILFGIIILLVGFRILWEGLKALYGFKFQNINLLMLIAVIGAFYIGQYVEAAVVIVLFALAERLEDYGIARSKSSLDKLFEQMPKYAYLKGMDEPINVAHIAVGQVIMIKPHHIIPLDGEVLSGQSFVDEATITGESIPRDKRGGDYVFAGTYNKQGVLVVKVSKLAGDSTLAKIREQTFDAVKHKANTQKFIEEFSLYYTPSIMGLAFIWTLLSWIAGKPFEVGLTQSLALLVISCPCALVISAPISLFSAIGNASSYGVLIKGGRYLEAMGQLKAIAFDKTRTLTYGEPNVTDVIPFNGHTRDSILSCAAGIEFFSEHPLSRCIIEMTKRENLVPHKSENYESVIGKGAKADCLVCDDKHHCIGKLEFILEEHHVSDNVLTEIERLQKEGKTVIVISTHRQVTGLIAVADAMRKECPQVIASLKKMGITSVMLTGDNDRTAKAVAKKAGIKTVESGLLPEDKARLVRELIKKHQVVAMMGDGVNDAPALASANVGISMTSLGSDMALDAASIVILDDHLNRLPFIVQLGRRTLAMIKLNTGIAVVIKLLFVALSVLGGANIAMAIFADVGVTLFVVLNSLRLLKMEITIENKMGSKNTLKAKDL